MQRALPNQRRQFIGRTQDSFSGVIRADTTAATLKYLLLARPGAPIERIAHVYSYNCIIQRNETRLLNNAISNLR